jgi:hypothetical protein
MKESMEKLNAVLSSNSQYVGISRLVNVVWFFVE